MQASPNPSSKLDHEMGQKYPLRILVAEDNIINQKVVLNLLSRLGYKADIANNGVEVLAKLESQVYDLILMDVQMPEMDGEEATALIRKQLPAQKQPRVVALTANAMQGDRERFLAAGMNDYLSKPINLEELVRALSNSRPLAGQADKATSPAQAAPEAEPRPAVNPDILNEFKEMMGSDSDQMLTDLIDLYLNNSPMLIEQMRRQIAAQRLPDLQRAAHTLKGNSSQLGAQPLADICFKLELLAKSGSTDGANDLLSQIQAEFSRVEKELQDRFL